MAFFIFVNGNMVHDEGEHDAQMRVIRAGGGPLSFASQADAEKAADALFASALAAFKESPRSRFRPDRANYVVATEPPPVPDPPENKS